MPANIIDLRVLPHTEEEIEEAFQRQEDIELAIGHHLLEALDLALYRHGTMYAFRAVEGLLREFESEYRRLTGMSIERKNNPRKEIGNSLRKKVYERDEYRCVECGDYHDLSVDHILPVSKGGDNTFDNLQTMCSECNSRKGARYEAV